MKIIEIDGPNGEIKQIAISFFTALDGWDVQRKFLEFAASRDSSFRREFTLEVLTYAKVVLGDRELPLSTDALINNHLMTWGNVEVVFEAVLEANGIDPKTHADKPDYWASAGAQMAIAFLAEASKLMGPALAMSADSFKPASPD